MLRMPSFFRKNRTVLTVILCIVIVAGLAWYFSPSSQSTRDDAAAKQVVQDFGLQLKNVSLLAPTEDLRAAIEKNYAAYVTPDLLAAWMANPSHAPGREVSSPWPDRVSAAVISTQGRGRIVNGEVIYVTSSEQPGESADTEPFVAQLVQIDGAWKIAAFEIQKIPSVPVTSDED